MLLNLEILYASMNGAWYLPPDWTRSTTWTSTIL